MIEHYNAGVGPQRIVEDYQQAAGELRRLYFENEKLCAALAEQPAEQPQEPSAGGVLFAVEQAIRNGDCPWQIEQAFDEYEAERRNSIKE